MKARIIFSVVLLVVNVAPALAQTSAFTYQGKLTDAGNPASGNYDMQFKLFDTATVGTGVQQGPTITNSSVSVTAGIFTVQLDFGAGAFSGPPRYLEIGVRPAGSPDPYTVLSPRQPVTSTPYSVRSLNSSVADVLSSACVGCVTSTQVGSVSGSAVTGPIPVASVPAGSGAYVQNTASQQASSNFNISGDGTAGGTLTGNIVKATTQFNIGGNHALSLASSTGVFAGRLAGVSNTTGSGNSFFGDSAGRFNATSSNNSFFGTSAGVVNTASDNSFFGAFAGDSNTTGTRNSFFGRTAGDANVSGGDNSFFGYTAGRLNTASFNSFFGSNAGNSTTTGANNAFFGYNAGQANTTGTRNTFFGSSAGSTSTVATDNTFVGYNAGANNTASANSFYGSGAGDSTTTGGDNAFFGYNAGQTNGSGTGNAFFGGSAGLFSVGDANSFFGYHAGIENIIGSRNSYFGYLAGKTNNSGADNTAIGANSDFANNLNFATAIGAGAFVSTSNSVVLGRNIDAVRIPGLLSVSGALGANSITTGEMLVNGKLTANGAFGARFVNNVELDSLVSGGNISLCLNELLHMIATCSSSLRYKASVRPFSGGLDIVRRLRPIVFDWKDGGMHDVGFAAEEVNDAEPLLTTRNNKGEIEGVKYAQITTVLVNAAKEQQAQIAAQQRTIEQQQQQDQAQQKQLRRQQQQLDALKKLVCLSHRRADVCR